MRVDEIDRDLQAVDPASAATMDRLELGPADGAPDGAAMPWPSARRRQVGGLLGLAGAAAAAMAAVVLLLFGGGASKSPPEAYGAELAADWRPATWWRCLRSGWRDCDF